jgi:hypothetical protein
MGVCRCLFKRSIIIQDNLFSLFACCRIHSRKAFQSENLPTKLKTKQTQLVSYSIDGCGLLSNRFGFFEKTEETTHFLLLKYKLRDRHRHTHTLKWLFFINQTVYINILLSLAVNTFGTWPIREN